MWNSKRTLWTIKDHTVSATENLHSKTTCEKECKLLVPCFTTTFYDKWLFRCAEIDIPDQRESLFRSNGNHLRTEIESLLQRRKPPAWIFDQSPRDMEICYWLWLIHSNLDIGCFRSYPRMFGYVGETDRPYIRNRFKYTLRNVGTHLDIFTMKSFPSRVLWKAYQVITRRKPYVKEG